ncbi:MAG: sulfatase-like hydrolase/transferase [Proteobacteria bacterium]|nr:sulfatase-like hydrolase/transferase [Pseudomonadota bacterium]
MGRKILFITTDQQRYDSLGCNGGSVARTPVVDRLAAGGVRFRRAYCQNPVCMPARSTMLTGQYVRTHGVIANGVPLPEDAPGVAAYLKEKAGYKTALLGKAHFEPGFDLTGRWRENTRAARGETGYWRGFDVSIQAQHIPAFGRAAVAHYGRWLKKNHPEHVASFAPLLDAEGGGDTGAPETKNNPIPRPWYHTDWVADQTIAFLDSLDDRDDWFVWMSFPDPHHPWDPPASELDRVPWRELELPPGHPGSDDRIRAILSQKPGHWSACYQGAWVNREGGPGNYRPGRLTRENILEINAKTHVMNELIDEACGRVMERIEARGWDLDTDVFFTTDHGEMQGDFGFIYKGPFHVDSLLRLPLVWRPAPSAGIAPAILDQPVGQVDLAPTFCAIAGLDRPEWMEGRQLPVSADDGRERVLCEWDSQFPGYGMHLRTIYRDGWLLTRYEPSTIGRPTGAEKHIPEGLRNFIGREAFEGCGLGYDGSEGELYRVDEDPHQWHNLWDDPGYRGVRSDLTADLYDSLPRGREHPLEVEAPA